MKNGWFGSFQDRFQHAFDKISRDPVRRQRIAIMITLSFRLILCATVLFLMWYYLLSYPASTEFSYTKGGLSTDDELPVGQRDVYDIETSPKYKKDSAIIIDVTDVVDSSITPISVPLLLQYASNVNVKTDREGEPGYNLQDIVGVDRALGAEAWGGHTGEVEPMLLAANGTSIRALYDYHNGAVVDRFQWLQKFDSAFFQKYIVNSPTSARYGEYGMDMGFPSNNIALTTPTAENFVCNLGIPRVQTRALVLEVTGCHVEVHSDIGSEYRMWFQKKGETNDIEVTTRYSFNETTGCRTRDVVVTISNPSCAESYVPGFDHGCEDSCKAILLKGDNARRLPIIVDAGQSIAAEPVSVHVIDPQLVLEHTRVALPWLEDDGPIPDLEIVGAKVTTSLANARIKNVKIETTEGLSTVHNLRFDTASIRSIEDDVYVIDSRDMALMYRYVLRVIVVADADEEEQPFVFVCCVCECVSLC